MDATTDETAPAAGAAASGDVHGAHGSAPSGPDRLAVHFSSKPSASRVGKPVNLSFHVEGTDGRPAKLATVHEKKVHTIVVSDDLSEFAHIHPEPRRGGSWSVDYTPAKAGGHTVFAEMTPQGRGAKTELKRFDLDVAGTAATPVVLKADKRAKTVGSLKVDLETDPRSLRAGEPAMLTFDLTDAKTGKAPDKMEKYLGAQGHAITISADRKNFVHAHPLEDGAMPDMPGMDHGAMPGMDQGAAPAASGKSTKIQFAATFPEQGLYKVWGQFQRDGKSVTVPFVVKVGDR